MKANSGIVAQISNLLYRTASSLRGLQPTECARSLVRLPIGNRRYSSLEICATPPRSPLTIGSGAFTFLELLVVIVVLGFLASSLLPALAKSRPTSLAYQCLNNHRRLCAAWRMYADDNRDRIVYSSDDGRGSLNPSNQYAWTWSHLDFSPSSANWDTNEDIVLRPLWPYTGRDASIYRCPADKFYVNVNGAAQPRVRSVSMNVYLGGYAGTDGGWTFMAPYRIFLKSTDLTAPGPAKTFVFIGERWDVINWGNFVTMMAGYPSNPSQYEFSEDLPDMSHDRGCGVSFADGRAEIHHWLDPRTTPTLASGTTPYNVPRDVDVAWLQDHATRPK